MGFFSKLKEGIKEIGSRLVQNIWGFAEGVTKVAEKGAVLMGWQETAERCRNGVEKCEEYRRKWKDRADIKQAERVFGKPKKPDNYRPDEKMREKENVCITEMENLLQGKNIEEVLSNQTAQERLDFIEKVQEVASLSLGIETKPILYESSCNNTTLGYYCREDNSIHLNEALITSDNIYFVKEQIFTIFHESMHALQWKVVEDLKNGGDGLGFSDKTLREWTKNFERYIDVNIDAEGYFTQPLERDAFGFEWRMKNFF